MRQSFNRTKHGALVDRNPDDASKTAKISARVLGNEAFGSILLSLVAGFVDTAGFMALFGLFTAHVTGDLITAAATIFEGPQQGAYVRLAMIPIFMITVAGITLFARSIQRRGAATLAPLLTLMALTLALFCAAGVYLQQYAKNPDGWAVALVGAIGVAAMGIQNGLMKGPLKSFTPTTFMTGNLTQFTVDFVEYLFPAVRDNPEARAAARRESGRHVRKSGFPLLSFIIGAGLAGWLTKKYGLASIALPTGIVGILSIIAWWRSRRRKAR